MGKHMFDVAVVQLTEAAADLPSQDGTGMMEQGQSKTMDPWAAGCANGTKIY